MFTSQETIQDLFAEITRGGSAMPNLFLQARAQGRSPGPPGPLHRFVVERQTFALKLYLLAHQLALGDPWDVPQLPAEVFGRALGKTNAGAEAAVSRAWRWLEQERLVSKRRAGRLLEVTLLREDGSGEPKTRPGNEFFTVPKEFFTEQHHEALRLDGTVALLIALKHAYREEWFPLPIASAVSWYGISASFLARGLDRLGGQGLIESRLEERPHVRARGGVVRFNAYRLLGDFARPSRSALDGVEGEATSTGGAA